MPKSDELVLLDAINSASPIRTRIVLIDICTQNPQACQLACDRLLLGHKQSGHKSSAKRKRNTTRQRYEICKQCKEEYDVQDNPKDACIWHPGRFPLRITLRGSG
jgi:hypothetical protein